jgi:hypothetical protein
MQYLKAFIDSATGFDVPRNIEICDIENNIETQPDPIPAIFLENLANEKIRKYQLVLKDIQVYDELHNFGNLGVFDQSFFEELEWLRDTWLDEGSEDLFDANRVCCVEDRLAALPFETALVHTNPLYRTMSLDEIWKDVFKEPAKWRLEPSLVMNMSKEDKLRIYKHFEYMCYFVINTRDTLLFDIKNDLGCE